MFLFHTFERFNYDIWMTFRSKNVFDLLVLNSVPTTTKEQALQGGELVITGVVKPRNFNIQAEVEGRLVLPYQPVAPMEARAMWPAYAVTSALLDQLSDETK